MIYILLCFKNRVSYMIQWVSVKFLKGVSYMIHSGHDVYIKLLFLLMCYVTHINVSVSFLSKIIMFYFSTTVN